MKSKLKFIIPIVLILVGAVYKFAFAKAPVVPKPKVAGSVYIMPKDFLINLADGKFAKLDVALVFAKDFALPAVGEAAPTPPEGYGALPEEPVVRAIVTDVITDSTSHDLLTRKGRRSLVKHIMHRIAQQTDVKLSGLLFTDVTVQ
jgi:flagellar basal body-associated protein FliL